MYLQITVDHQEKLEMLFVVYNTENIPCEHTDDVIFSKFLGSGGSYTSISEKKCDF